jgi:hypothetical protein
MRNGRTIFPAITALLFAVAASVSLAQQVPHVGPGPGAPLPRPIRTPLPLPGFPSSTNATPSPGASPTASPAGLTLHPQHTFPGQIVPLSALPQLPPQTPQNTAYILTPGNRYRRPMAANGSTITVTTDASNPSCSTATGTQIPVGCDVKWQSSGLPTGGTPVKTYQDYFLTLNTSTGTAVGSTYTTSSGTQHTSANLTTSGTYVFAVYDTANAKWATVVYVTVGTINFFGTYADSGATTAQTQFTAPSSGTTNVYVNATGLVQGDNYVVLVESTSANPTCTYIAPPGTGTITANAFCDPTTSTGVTAVVGASSSAAITVTWPISSSTAAGTYSVILYNLTTGTRMAMRQVSITTGSSGTLSLTPVAGNGTPVMQYPPSAPSNRGSGSTVFAFDNTSEQSDKAWTLTGSGFSNGTYDIANSDPTGAASLVGGTTQTYSSGFGAVSYSFSNTNSPSNYVANGYTVTAGIPSSGIVTPAGSTAWKLLGYHVTTDFTSPFGTAMSFGNGTSATTGLEFTNDGDSVWGTGNSDTISEIAFDSGAYEITFDLGTTKTACGGNCTTQTSTATDSSGNTWNLTNTCNTTGTGGCTMVAVPATSGGSLAVGAYLTISNITFTTPANNGHCTSGCVGTTSILPTHGDSWSNNNGVYYAANPVYFTNSSSSTTNTGTASISHYGWVSGGTLKTGYETHGYAYNNSNMTYTQTSPFSYNPGDLDEWKITLNNTSSGTSPTTEVAVGVPTGYLNGGSKPSAVVDTVNSPGWSIFTCPSGVSSADICLKNTSGIADLASATIYLELTPPPSASFSYTDWSLEALSPNIYPFTAASTITPFVPDTSSYDSTASAGYSLIGSDITPGFSPTSEGASTTNSVQATVTNTSTAQDSNPDYLDLVTITLPSGLSWPTTPTSFSGLPTGWSLLGTDTLTGSTRYWFGLCSAQFVTADAPPSSPTPSTVPATIPSCGAAMEQNAIAPGSSFTASATMTTSATTGTYTATMYAHGANGAAWSASHTFNMTVSSVSASAGFSGAGGYPAANTVSSPKTPQVGADTDNTYGNAYTYVITNTSGSGHTLTSATITIPGKDTSSVLPADGTAWTITNTPSVSGGSGCSITSFNSATTAGANGNITIGGGSCVLNPGSSWTVSFDAKAPYTVNDTYQFPTSVNGSVSASEAWSTDTIVQIILGASLNITVDPGTDTTITPNSIPVVSCPTCSFSGSAVNMGTVANGSSVSGQDVVRVQIRTDAGSSDPWALYVSVNTNPSNTAGTYTNELVTSIDNGSNRSEPQSGFTFDRTSYAVVPSSGTLELVNTSGVTATRNPFDELMNFEVYINGGTTAQQNTVVTYTWIAN